MKALKILRRIVLAVNGLAALHCSHALADGELAANTAAAQPADRVRAAVQLYLEGGGQEQIAAPLLVKLGNTAKTELRSMQQTAANNEEAAAIEEILQVYISPAKISAPKRTAVVSKAQRPAPARETVTRSTTAPAPRQSIAESGSPLRRPGSLKVRIGVTAITHPLQPSATRF